MDNLLSGSLDFDPTYSVNKSNGEPSFAIKLISFGGEDDTELGYNVSISYLGGCTHNALELSNSTSPAGMLGVGWSMAPERIVSVTQGEAGQCGAGFYLLSSAGSFRLFRTEPRPGDDPATQFFEVFGQPFWKVTYWVAQEKWVIIKENAVVYTYGGNTVGYSVKWGGSQGNWIGPTISLKDQTRYVTVWQLASMVNTWGDNITFEYDAEEVPVGAVTGKTFTRSLKVSRINDSKSGKAAVFRYGTLQYDAHIQEYQPQHTSETGPFSVFQDHFETHFLQGIDLVTIGDATNTALASFDFSFVVQNLSSNPTDPGLFKRFLTSAFMNVSGRAVQGLRFEYCTQHQATGGHLGSIKTVTTSNGLVTSFEFEKISFQRTEATLYRTLGNHPGYAPRVWMGPGYNILLRYNSNLVQDLWVNSWNGNWYKHHAHIPWRQGINLDSLQVQTSEGFFVVTYNTPSQAVIHLLHTSIEENFGEWIVVTNTIPIPNADVKTLLTIGSSFAVVIANSTQSTFIWHVPRKKWIITTCALDSSCKYGVQAISNLFLRAKYQPSSRQCAIELFHLKCDGSPEFQPTSIPYPMTNVDWDDSTPYKLFSVQPTYAVITLVSSGAVKVAVVSWSQEYVPQVDLTFTYAPLSGQSAQDSAISIARDNLVGSGPHMWRYDGVIWRHHQFPAPFYSTTSKVAYGSDMAVIATGNSAYVCYFDPRKGDWDHTLYFLTAKVFVPSSNSTLQPVISGSCLTFGANVWVKNPSERLEFVCTLNNPVLSTINNNAPQFISYEDIFGNTILVPFMNGKPMKSRSWKLPNQRHFITGDLSGKPGTDLSGSTQLFTYSGSTFSDGSVLKCYRYVTAHYEDWEHPHHHVVTRVTMNAGFQTQYTLYRYDVTNCTLEDLGQYGERAEFQACTVYSTDDGSMVAQARYPPPQVTPYGKKEFKYYNNRVSSAGGKAVSQYHTLLRGSMYQTIVYDEQGAVLATDENKYQVFTTRQVINGDGTLSTVPLYGFYARMVQLINTVNWDTLNTATPQTKSTVTAKQTVFSEVTGLQKQQISSCYNSQGQVEKTQEVFIYSWEVPEYAAAMISTHNWTSVAMVVQVVNGATVKAIATSLKQWAPGKWDIERTFIAKSASVYDAATGAFSFPSSGTSSDQWLKQAQVTVRNATGDVLELMDAEGTPIAHVFDENSSMKVASSKNARLSELVVAGFEGYDDLSRWQGINGTNAMQVGGDAHSGVKSLKISQGGDVSTTINLIPNKQYLLSCWVKVPNGFDGNTNTAAWKLMDAQGQSINTFPINNMTAGTWCYWHTPINVPRAAVSLHLINLKPAELAFLVDDVQLAPLQSQTKMNVYDNEWNQVIGEWGLDGSGVTHLVNHNRDRTGFSGSNQEMQVSPTFIDRQLARVGSGAFSWDVNQPNITTKIAASDWSISANFVQGKEWANSWTFAPPSSTANWVPDGKGGLKHNSVPGTQETITLQPSVGKVNMSAFVSVANTSSTQPFGIKLGTSITVSYSKTAGLVFMLKDQTNAIPTPWIDPNNVASDWLVAVLSDSVDSGSVVFFVDGKPVFSAVQPSGFDVSGGLQLFAQDGNTTFRSVMAFIGGPLSVNIQDSLANSYQTHEFSTGSSFIVGCCVFDGMMRKVIDVKPVPLNDLSKFGKYRTEMITKMDWTSGIMTGAVSDAYPGDEGYPYTRTVFDVLDRPIKSGSPGKQFAIIDSSGSVNRHITTIKYGTNAPSFFGNDNLPEGQYRVVKTTNPDGADSFEIYDMQQRSLGYKSNAQDYNFQVVRNVLDGLGNVVKEYLPNFFEQTNPDVWSNTNTFDFMGRPLTRSTVDTSQSKFVYSSSGLLRFWQDGQASTERVVMYRKYDPLGRITEEGTINGFDWNQSFLQDKAFNAADWPDSSNALRRWSYDGDGSDPNLLGNLQKLSVTPNITETFQYDASGNTTSVQRQVQDSSYTIQVGYDKLNKVKMVTYPSPAPIPQVTYSYAVNGNLISVGTPQNPRQFSAFTYTPSSDVASTVVNPSQPVTCALKYNPPLWLSNVNCTKADKSQVMSEDLSYTTGGYQDASYFSGQIAQVHLENVIPGATGFTSSTWKFQHDKLLRLGVSQNQGTPAQSSNIQFDMNSNIINQTRGTSTLNYQYLPGSNKLQKINKGSSTFSTLSYNANGAVTGATHKNITNITYEPLRRKTDTITLSDGRTVSFQYGFLRRRVTKTVKNPGGTQTTKMYVHGTSRLPLMEMITQNGGAPTCVQYIRDLSSNLLAVVKGANTFTVLRDHLGSTRVVLDSNGNAVAAFDYTEFGDLIQGLGDVASFSYRWTGHEYDEELGMYNMGARLYDPTLCIFLSADLAEQFTSPYVYGGNDPIDGVDPDGEFFMFLIAAIVIGGLIGGTLSVGIQAAHGNVNSVGDGFAYFGIGFLAGAIGGAVTAGAGALGAAIGAAPILIAIVGGAAAGAADAVITQGFNNLYQKKDFGEGLGEAAIWGAVGGAAMGGLFAGAGRLTRMRFVKFRNSTRWTSGSLRHHLEFAGGRGRGISGGHNDINFQAEVTNKGYITAPGPPAANAGRVPGIVNFRYGTAAVIGRGRGALKTTYNPALWSNSEMTRAAEQAGVNRWLRSEPDNLIRRLWGHPPQGRPPVPPGSPFPASELSLGFRTNWRPYKISFSGFESYYGGGVWGFGSIFPN